MTMTPDNKLLKEITVAHSEAITMIEGVYFRIAEAAALRSQLASLATRADSAGMNDEAAKLREDMANLWKRIATSDR
jgi:hypothetical protein